MENLKKVYLNYENVCSSLVSLKINCDQLFNACGYLIEMLTFSDHNEIYTFLREKNEKDIIGLPFWFRSLAFKLMVLKDPINKDYIKAAIQDLQIFGDDIWKLEIEVYKKMLKKLD